MKNKFIYIIGVALLSSYSCQKSKLYPQSQTSVVADDQYLPFSTPARVSSQVLGLYSNIRNGQLYGGRFQAYNDVKAENWLNSTANSVTAYQTWTQTVTNTSSEVLNLWSQAYFTINNCNLFLDGMAAKGSAVVGSALAANYIAEAKFIRAIAYYTLLEMYCKPYAPNAGASPGVPLRLTGNAVFATYDLAPATVAQVFTQVTKDLDDAEVGLPLTYPDAVTNTTRAHRNTAIAFKTRVYLATQQYASVVTEANKIVGATTFTASAGSAAAGGVNFALQPTVANVYKTPYTTTESILSMPFTTQEQVGAQNALADYFAGLGSSEFYLNPNGVLADPAWKNTDTRKTTLITVKSGKSYTLKYPSTSPYLDWAPVMRYAEVLLNLAEAKVRVNNVVDAQSIALLNAVRGRSDASTVYTTASLPTVAAFTAAVLQERNIEFLGEGLRWNDEWRLNLTIPSKTASIPAVASTDPAYIWPVSGNEQLYNKLIGR